jgi:hypothetical protein
MTFSHSATPAPNSGRGLLALGLGLTILGIAAYAAQLWAQRLTIPWYLPPTATLGVVCVIAALWRRRTVVRWLALVLVVLLAGAEWLFVVGTRLPRYTGPVAAGQPFPDFTTSQADGKPFARRDLEGDQNTVLVFFRGRW